jgi:HSP20 family protein
MAIKDLVKLNGETSNLPVRREEEYGFPTLHRELTQWMEQWDRVFDRFFGPSMSLSPWRNMTAGWGGQANWMPAVNISESEKEYRVTAELPGMNEKDIELTLSPEALILKGEKKDEYEDKGSNYYRMERSFGSFHRSIPLPEGVNTEQVDANFHNGVLTVTLPKLPDHQRGGRKISIKTEGNK